MPGFTLHCCRHSPKQLAYSTSVGYYCHEHDDNVGVVHFNVTYFNVQKYSPEEWNIITDIVYRCARRFVLMNNIVCVCVMCMTVVSSEGRSQAVRREERIGAKTPSNRPPFHS